MMTMRIASYNIMQPISRPWRVYGQEERAARIAESVATFLSDVDVLVLQELITPDAIRTVVADLHKLGFVYRAGGLPGTTFRVPGGVEIFSRYPIAANDHCVFSACSGFDCFASKGVVYACIAATPDSVLHMFATHMQSDAGGVAERRAQAHIIADCIESLDLKKDTPIILVGDLNIDLQDSAELREFAHVVGMQLAPNDATPTMDPHTNPLVGHDNPSQWPPGCWSDYRKTLVCACCPTTRLDHMFIRGDIRCTSKVRTVEIVMPPFQIDTDIGKITLTSPSDHYPIVGTFQIAPSPAVPAAPSRMTTMRTISPGWTAHDIWMWSIVSAVVGAIVAVIIIAATLLHHQ